MNPKYATKRSPHAVDIMTAEAAGLINYFQRFPRPLQRVFLDYMGVPMGKHGTVAKTKELVATTITNEPDKSRKCINILVHKKYDKMVDTSEARPDKVEDIVQEAVNRVLAEHSIKADMHEKLAAAALQERLYEEVRNAALAEAKKVQRHEFVIKNGKKSKKMADVLPKEFEDIVSLASIRQNILLTGPSGCGKTYVAGKLAEALDLEYGSVSCSVGMSESHLNGWLLPIGDDNKFVHVPTGFIECYEQGGVFLFDEFDAADENTVIVVNAALANEGFHLPQRYDNPWVEKHKDFVCIAAANTMGDGESTLYSGRNALDGATLDRFRAGVVEMDYSDVVETALIDPEILAWGKRVRQCIRDHRYERIMSTRVMLDFTKQKAALGWALEKFQKSYFADWTAQERLAMEGTI